MSTPRIVPITDFRTNLAFYCGLVASNGQPIVVARHRRQDVILVRRDEWERLSWLQAETLAVDSSTRLAVGDLDLGPIQIDQL